MTPMMKQFNEIKKKHPDALLFFRVGDFYEMFGEDAKRASKICNIALTSRHKGSANEIQMAGVPHHAAEQYIAKLTKAQQKVAICDQVSDPSLPGIVKRDVTRIVTPGTTMDGAVLDDKENNYLMCAVKKKEWGIAFVDLSTGSFEVCSIDDAHFDGLLYKIHPSEILVPEKQSHDAELRGRLSQYHVTPYISELWEKPSDILAHHFQAKDVSGFGIESLEVAVEAAAYLLKYLQDTQKTVLSHITHVSRYNPHEFMLLDEATVRNLELIYNAQDFSRENTLLSVIDVTQTAMGARMLRNWVVHPLLDIQGIQERLDAVDAFVVGTDSRERIRDVFTHINDIERLTSRIGCRRANPRDVISLRHALEHMPVVKESVSSCNDVLLNNLAQDLDGYDDVIELIQRSIQDDPSTNINQGNCIRDGYNAELDELRTISGSGKEWLKQLQDAESKKTGISTLKVGFNKVFGYYIEVSKSNVDKVPESYVRKQTLTNAERYITPELKEQEEKILGAQDKILELETSLFLEVLDEVSAHITKLQRIARAVAQLDVLSSFAILAIQRNYSKPELSDNNILEIIAGRHPVIEAIMTDEQYVPNDISIGREDAQLIVLTGPNMAGKSSYLRQNALIVLLAQLGCFVPAESARIGVVDRIFTRVGASDNLARGRSTFLVEMQEAANIIHNATDKSLIIFDELGRGTSTYDGVSIAWAVIEYVYKNIKAKTLFATHYHELAELQELFDGIKNYCVAVSEHAGGITFLRKVIEGSADRSYGIEVAKLAGLPHTLIARAQVLLQELEVGTHIVPQKDAQASLFAGPASGDHPVVEQLRHLDVNSMTPLDALNALNELKNELSS